MNRRLTPAEVHDVAPGSVVRLEDGTIACRHWGGEHGVVFGDERTFPWSSLNCSAVVLWAPGDENRPEAGARVVSFCNDSDNHQTGCDCARNDRKRMQDAVVARANTVIAHELVVDVMAELRGNLGVADQGLPAYGISKVAHYTAMVAIAQTLGIDPDLLRLTNEQANSELLRIAAEAVALGIPVMQIDLRGDE